MWFKLELNKTNHLQIKPQILTPIHENTAHLQETFFFPTTFDSRDKVSSVRASLPWTGPRLGACVSWWNPSKEWQKTSLCVCVEDLGWVENPDTPIFKLWSENISCSVPRTGQYWQVADGPSSSLTIDTDNIPLGSYTMEIVIYHYRSKEKFIPLGYASTQFSITG